MSHSLDSSEKVAVRAVFIFFKRVKPTSIVDQFYLCTADVILDAIK